MQTPDVYALLQEPKRLLTFEEVRAILHISESTLRRWIADSRLKFFRLGRQLRFDPAIDIKRGTRLGREYVEARKIRNSHHSVHAKRTNRSVKGSATAVSAT